MMRGTANENAAGILRICKRSDQPEIETQQWSKTDYYVESLTGQRHDRGQTEVDFVYLKPRTATVDSCFDLVGSLKHGGAESEAIGCLTDRPPNAQW